MICGFSPLGYKRAPRYHQYNNMRKVRIWLISAVLLFTPVFALAQTTSDQQLIEQLRAQIASLQAQLERLLQTQAAATPTTPSCPTRIFTYSLYLGQSDISTQGQVSALQKFLTQYPTIYPEGLVTGYFGPLTERAVQRFQAQYGIVSSGAPDTTGYGVVGPATKEKIRGLCPAPNGAGTTPIGGLSISPDSANMRVGDTAALQAFYQPSQPPCPTGLYCAQVLPSPYPVEAEWASNDPKVAAVSYKQIPCPGGVPPTNAGCFDFTTVEVSGISVGVTQIRAVYSPSSGNELTATAQVGVISLSTLPSVIVHADKISGLVPLTVAFTATLFSFPSCGNTYTWNFGDGISSSSIESCSGPVTTIAQRTISATHTYGNPGTFNASLTVSNTVSNAITINAVQFVALPFISSLSPASGPIGAVVTIMGSGFASGSNTVNFGSAAIKNISSPDGKKIVFNVPFGYGCEGVTAPYACDPVLFRPGTYTVSVTNANGTSNQASFTVTAPGILSISSLSPSSGPVGTKVTITGPGFTPTGNDIHFAEGGIRNVSSSNGTTLIFTVPDSISGCDFWTSGFACTQPVRLVTPGDYVVFVRNANGQSNSVNFTVDKVGPVIITSLAPSSGPIGTVVTIKGSGFSRNADNRVNIHSASGNVGTIIGLKSSDGVTLQFIMPSELIPYCRPPIICAVIITPVVAGVYNIDVVSPLAEGGEALSNSLSFTVPLSGSITVLSPNGGEEYTMGTVAYSFAHWRGSAGKAYKVQVLSADKLNSWGIVDSYGGTPDEDYYMSWLVGKVFDANYQLLDLAAGNYYLRIQTVVDGVTISDESDAPFSIVSSTIGSLTVTRNTNVNPTFYPGSVNAQIGSYVLTASPAEAVNLSSLTLYLRTNSSQDIGNVRAFVGGTQFGNARATILGGYDVASFAGVSSVNIAAGGSKQVDVWADILPSAVTGTSPALTTLASCLGTGAATGAVISCSPTEVPGWGVNIAFLSRGGSIPATETNLASILSAIQTQLSAIAEIILQLQR